MFVLILQVPSFILVGPNIFLSILLSNTESFRESPDIPRNVVGIDFDVQMNVVVVLNRKKR